MQKMILVLGGTGLLGAPVARRLQADGFGVRILARDTGKAGMFFDESFEIVAGDATDCESVKQAMMGCAGVHLTLNGEAELIGAQHVGSLARTLGVERITYISGATACEENRWFPMIDAKMRAEAAIKASGVPYTIFCPTWPMEMLARYARNGEPFLIGDQFFPIHFYAADDLARMVSVAYQTDEATNQRLTIHGPEGLTMPDALYRYCAVMHPDAGDIQIIPVAMAQNIAAQTGNKMLEFGAALSSYFEKVGEMGDPTEANRLLGAPSVTLDDWLAAQHVN